MQRHPTLLELNLYILSFISLISFRLWKILNIRDATFMKGSVFGCWWHWCNKFVNKIVTNITSGANLQFWKFPDNLTCFGKWHFFLKFSIFDHLSLIIPGNISSLSLARLYRIYFWLQNWFQTKNCLLILQSKSFHRQNEFSKLDSTKNIFLKE